MAQGVTGYFDLQDNSYGATLRVHYSETYETATNTSSVTITKLEVSQSAYYGVTHYFHGTITINGSTAVTLSNNGLYVGAKNTFYQIPDASGSVSVAHNSDGSKTTSISVSAKAYNGSSQLKWSVSGSKTIALTTIPRASSFTVSNGTLGVAQTIKVTRQSTSFSHTITYKCGVASGTICDKSTAESISFTPPIDLAGQNTTGTSLTMTFTLQTYSGSTAVGSAVSTSVSMSIPASVKPGCSLSYMDASGYADKFGGYVQGQSKLLIALVGSAAYGSPIASYRTVVDGTTYTASSFTTGVLTGTGNQTISATVTDKRGRTSDPATATINVLAYSAPKISKLSVNRCNEDGTENNTGSFAKVTYSFSITSLSEKNTKIATLYYKKSSDSSYTPKVLESAYSVTNGTFVFPADDGSSYDVYIELRDSFTSTKKSTSVSTADVIMHFRADGNGMGLGKVSEKSNTLDMGWDIELNGHNLLKNGVVPYAPAGYGLGTDWGYAITDANKALLNGVYACANPSNCTNFPTHEAQQYGPLVVFCRAQNISQTVYFRNRKVCRFSEDRGATWTPWEWENPPLSYGVEYRTTERHNGKSVYVKCVQYGYIAVGTTTIAHGISSIDDVVGLDIINRTYGYFSNSAEVHGSADRTNVSVTSAWAMGGFVYIIKYTKL